MQKGKEVLYSQTIQKLHHPTGWTLLNVGMLPTTKESDEEDDSKKWLESQQRTHLPS